MTLTLAYRHVADTVDRRMYGQAGGHGGVDIITRETPTCHKSDTDDIDDTGQ